MRNFIYRCPTTNLNVQGSIGDEEAAKGEEYIPLTCLACGLAHMVNPQTGKLMSEKSAPRDDR